jgi:hypothetical protein
MVMGALSIYPAQVPHNHGVGGESDEANARKIAYSGTLKDEARKNELCEPYTVWIALS